MRNIITILLLLVSSVAFGQGTINFGASRPQDTSLSKGQLKLTAYANSNTSRYLTVNSNGYVVFGVPAGGGSAGDSTVFFTVYRADTMRIGIYGKIYSDSVLMRGLISSLTNYTDSLYSALSTKQGADSLLLAQQIETLNSDVSDLDSALGVAFGAIADLYDTKADKDTLSNFVLHSYLDSTLRGYVDTVQLNDSLQVVKALIDLKGDVIGAASSVDNNIVSFNGTTGKIIKDALFPTNRAINSLSMGLATGGQLTINADPTKFDISAGNGFIVDNYTDPNNPIIHNVAWSAKLAQTVTNLATSTVTYVFLDTSGTVIQTTVEPTPAQHRQYLFLGQLGHTNLTSISTALSTPEPVMGLSCQLKDFEDAVGIVNSGNTITANGANLKLNKSVGNLYSSGSNFHNDILNPNYKSIAAATAFTFRYRTQTGNGASTSDISAGFYDVGGTITALSGTKYTNQRVFLTLAGNVVIQYGQSQYNTMAAALAALPYENFVLFQNLVDNAVLLGVITVVSSATHLSNTNQATFTKASKFGELAAGVSATTTTGGGSPVLGTPYHLLFPSGTDTLKTTSKAYVDTTDDRLVLAYDSTTTSVSTDPNGGIKIWGSNRMGMGAIRMLDTVSIPSALQRALNVQITSTLLPNTTLLSGTGTYLVGAPSTIMTGASTTSVVASYNSTIQHLNYTKLVITSATGSNLTVGIRTNSNLLPLGLICGNTKFSGGGGRGTLIGSFPSYNSGQRIYIGYSSVLGAGTSDPSSYLNAENALGVGKDAADGELYFFHGNSITVPTKVATGVVPNAEDVYRVTVFVAPNSTYYIQLEVISKSAAIRTVTLNPTTNVPPIGARIYPRHWVNNAATGVAISYGFIQATEEIY